ncbi:FxsA family protein [Iodobacter ciconiae]|uniref:FxsA family protein n=1 Tax=Iodobacter ciconiae TaxID=2496266 RepID=A0A3S8ZTV5_9NEIS|nr:FxsA family protein [Iodobacter ciconiae]AZN36889.1 FxsA family protein [Iodobacter ciconiae]
MPYLLLLLFVAYPIAEIITIVLLAKAIGTFWVVLWLVTAFLGGLLMLRHHKLAVGAALLGDLRAGRLSVRSLFAVARYYIAAVLLLLPGILGDVLALVLLLPWGALMGKPAAPLASAPFSAPAGDVIDGEYRQVKPDVDRLQG